MRGSFKYTGHELELFQHATNWKKYFSTQIKKYIRQNVLEVGAGIGATTKLLNDGKAKQWILLEPDTALHSILQSKKNELPPNCSLLQGTIHSLNTNFDTIIYIDVLEHIENDSKELSKAASLLEPGGNLVVLAPAFQSLFSPFDKAIGHYRRYNRKMVDQIRPAGLRTVTSRYYDSMGYFASLANKLLLKQKYPGLKQVLFWDRWLVPISEFSDRLFFHSFGKCIITVWQKHAAA